MAFLRPISRSFDIQHNILPIRQTSAYKRLDQCVSRANPETEVIWPDVTQKPVAGTKLLRPKLDLQWFYAG